MTNLSRITLPAAALLFAVTSTALAQKTSQIDTSHSREIRLNINAISADDVAPDDIFSSVDYIPLETTEKSLFGQIDQLELLDGNYVILDREATRSNREPRAAVLIFNKDGHFRARIDMRYCFALMVNATTKEVVINLSDDILYYNLDGKLIRKETPLFRFYAFALLPGNQTLYFRGHGRPEKTSTEPEYGQKVFHQYLWVNPDKFVTKFYLPADTAESADYTFPLGAPNYITKSGADVFVHPPFTYDILSVEDGKLIKKYNIILPLSNLASKKSWFLGDNDRIAYSRANNLKFTNAMNVYKAGNILTFTLYAPSITAPVFFNLKNNVATAASAIKTNNTTVVTKLKNPVVASDGNQMYTWVRATDFFGKAAMTFAVGGGYATTKAQDGVTGYAGNSDKLKQFLKEGNSRSNPVLVILKVI